MARLSQPQSFLRDEGAGVTAYGLTVILTMLAMGGIAIDIGNAYRVRTQLQVASDAVAHAALYTREMNSRDQSIDRALDVLEVALPVSSYGKVMTDADIEFGYWDYENQAFTPNQYSKEAVRVRATRSDRRDNSVATYLLKLVGQDVWEIGTESVFATYLPMCFREGFVADDEVDLQSNNAFFNGFCVHSNDHVQVNSNNYFEANTVVSMPDKSTIELPNSGFETNEGLEAALRDGAYRIRIVNRLPSIIAELTDPMSDYVPDYISNSSVKTLNNKNIKDTDLEPGRIHTLSCNGGSQAIFPGAVITDVVLVTDCKIKFSQGAVLENVIVATSNTDTKSINAPSGLQIGRDDNCAVDGGSQLLTLGGVDVASDLKAYGGQIIAVDNIEFSANANGIEGASFISGGTISGTSNMTMGFCGDGMERNFAADYFRLVH